jgi:hypothetical protein
MRPEYLTIHHALHTPNQHSVEVNGVHRIIKKTRSGKRYTIFVDYDSEMEWMLVAVAKNVTVVSPMLAGYRCTFGRLTIRG